MINNVNWKETHKKVDEFKKILLDLYTKKEKENTSKYDGLIEINKEKLNKISPSISGPGRCKPARIDNTSIAPGPRRVSWLKVFCVKKRKVSMEAWKLSAEGSVASGCKATSK